jgi:putative transposase
MRTSKFTPEQMVMALRQVEAGTPVEEVCRKLGISEATFRRWKKRLGSLGISEVRELRQLREENRIQGRGDPRRQPVLHRSARDRGQRGRGQRPSQEQARVRGDSILLTTHFPGADEAHDGKNSCGLRPLSRCWADIGNRGGGDEGVYGTA